MHWMCSTSFLIPQTKGLKLAIMWKKIVFNFCYTLLILCTGAFVITVISPVLQRMARDYSEHEGLRELKSESGLDPAVISSAAAPDTGLQPFEPHLDSRAESQSIMAKDAPDSAKIFSPTGELDPAASSGGVPNVDDFFDPVTSENAISRVARIEQVCEKYPSLWKDITTFEDFCPSYKSLPRLGYGYLCAECTMAFEKSRVIVHSAPKIGSNYWRHIRKEIRYCPTGGECVKEEYKLMHKEDLGPLMRDPNWKHVLVVRDPMTRLFSGFEDKIVLMRMKVQAKRVSLFRQKQSDPYHICGNNLTFTDFIQYATEVTKHYQMDDTHWMSYVQVFAPCSFKWAMVIKLETFAEDLKVFEKLTQLKLPPISDMDKHGKVFRPGAAEVDAFRFYDEPDYKICYDPKIILQQILSQVKHLGYLEPEATLDDVIKIITKNETMADCMKESISTRDCAMGMYEALEQQLEQGNSFFGLNKERRMGFYQQQLRTVGEEVLNDFYKYNILDYAMFNYDHPLAQFKE